MTVDGPQDALDGPQDALDGPQEALAFERLQARLVSPLGRWGGPAPSVVVIVPSFTLDPAGMRKIPGVMHYEERMLSFLQLLRDPERQIVYLTSQPLPDIVVDYALGLVSSLPTWHARRRLTLLSPADDSPEPLTQKLLRRPDLVERVRQLVPADGAACIVAFNGSQFERTLAVRLGIPLYACDPALSYLGSKSGSREVFRESGVPFPPGVEGLRDHDDLVKALTQLRASDGTVGRAIVKLNESFGAGGNVLFDFDGAPSSGGLEKWVRHHFLEHIEFATPPDTWESYAEKLTAMGGVVEQFIEGNEVTSPSVQVELRPGGQARILSTQDQRFVGGAKQTYAGGTFPAHPAYRLELHRLAQCAGQTLAGKGAVGITSIDFLCVRNTDRWSHYALEVNLRMGGGTNPLMFLDGATEGRYEPESGEYRTGDGQLRCYVASDRLQHASYRALAPEDLLDTAFRQGLLYRSRDRRGAIFHMLGALRDFGKVGVVVIDETIESAEKQYELLVAAMDVASSKRREPSAS